MCRSSRSCWSTANLNWRMFRYVYYVMASDTEYRDILRYKWNSVSSCKRRSDNICNSILQRSLLAIWNIIFIVGVVNCQLRNDFKGRGRKMGVVEGGGGDLALDFKNFWDGVYNFFFCPPPPSYWTVNFICTSSASRAFGHHCKKSLDINIYAG